MLEIITKYGNLKVVEAEKNGLFNLLDSDNRVLFWDCDFTFIYDSIVLLNQKEHIADWLKEFYGVCWGSKQDCLDYAKDYAETNGRKFDKKWALDNLNRIGDTYILFEYGEAYCD